MDRATAALAVHRLKALEGFERFMEELDQLIEDYSEIYMKDFKEDIKPILENELQVRIKRLEEL